MTLKSILKRITHGFRVCIPPFRSIKINLPGYLLLKVTGFFHMTDLVLDESHFILILKAILIGTDARGGRAAGYLGSLRTGHRWAAETMETLLSSINAHPKAVQSRVNI